MSIFQKKIWFETKNLIPYPLAMNLMQDYVQKILEGKTGSLFWLLEHPALLTAGVRAKEEDLVSPDSLPIFKTNRGGQWTYHGPGQQIIYTMLDLRENQGCLKPYDLREFVFLLESWIISTLLELGLESFRREGLTGVWIRTREGNFAKIAAIGLRATKWISWHGVSLNLNPLLSHYDAIVPCGIKEDDVTSLEAQGFHLHMSELRQRLFEQCHKFFGEFTKAENIRDSNQFSVSEYFEKALANNILQSKL
ncbi:lipoyl(octanoyl) transferase LipB [Acetobacteraceae bacterium]|nr:lipoyl(octanoyl) transferase LipB [Acetobacteraceae bacterium]